MADDRRKVLADPDRHPEHRADLGDGERGADPVPGGIGQQEHRALGLRALGGRRQARPALARDSAVADDVVGVPAGLVRRLAPAVDVESGHDRNPLGQGVLLDAPGDLEIALELQERLERLAHPPVGIGEPMDFPDRRGHGRPGIEVAAADSLALAHQGLDRAAVAPGEAHGADHGEREPGEHDEHDAQPEMAEVPQQVGLRHHDRDRQLALRAQRDGARLRPPGGATALQPDRPALARRPAREDARGVGGHAHLELLRALQQGVTLAGGVQVARVAGQADDPAAVGQDHHRAVLPYPQARGERGDVGQQQVDGDDAQPAVAPRERQRRRHPRRLGGVERVRLGPVDEVRGLGPGWRRRRVSRRPPGTTDAVGGRSRSPAARRRAPVAHPSTRARRRGHPRRRAGSAGCSTHRRSGTRCARGRARPPPSPPTAADPRAAEGRAAGSWPPRLHRRADPPRPTRASRRDPGSPARRSGAARPRSARWSRAGSRRRAARRWPASR